MKNIDKVFQFRLTKSELETLKKRADAADMSASEFLRRYITENNDADIQKLKNELDAIQ